MQLRGACVNRFLSLVVKAPNTGCAGLPQGDCDRSSRQALRPTSLRVNLVRACSVRRRDIRTGVADRAGWWN